METLIALSIFLGTLFTIYKYGDPVATFLVYCRKTKWLKWLAYDIIGDSSDFLDYWEKYGDSK